MRDASVAATGTLVPWVTQKVTNRFGWMRWIVMCNLPFSFCESEEIPQYMFTNLPPISVDTLYGDMEKVVKATQKSIGEEIPNEFGLILDGWTHGSEHYLAVFACFEAFDGPWYPLLSMAPIMDGPDDALNADGHAAAIAVVCHRPNLAVRAHLAPHEDDLEKLQTLMRKLRTIKQAAKLRQTKKLHFSMSYAKTRHLSSDDDDLEDFIPSRSAHRSLRQLFEGLRDVASISKKLQTDGLSMLDARDLLDGMLEAF
ncbi:hypothetical protein JG688_00017290 [Phytophthora aleatoria]|uniref:Uncharacterized protein n=1 Tax=Phytophthora aleatoria TaxID=2496075 RepID=A0A8J5IAR5_9STRA|nr:hypothetical protein JG688_00017290 [Phytophthora aleatoria]